MINWFRKKDRSFLLLLIPLNGILAVLSTPITVLGDAGAYILLSKVFLGLEEANLAHRSPLYSLIIAGLMLIFQPPFFFKIIILFQYTLVGVTTWLLFRIFRPLFTRNQPAMLIGLLFNLSLSTLYYSNIILTEILTVFLLVASTYILIQAEKNLSYYGLFLLGIMVGLLTLARFSTTPLIVTFVALLTYVLVRKQESFVSSVKALFVFLAPWLLIINLWCAYNYKNNGFYGLFPRSGGGVPRNAVVSSIRPDNIVSDENKPILEIFLKARESYFKEKPATAKGSLAGLDYFNLLDDLYSGFSIYMNAEHELRVLFGLNDRAGEYEMSRRLKGFYKEIGRQNRSFITKMRFISFLSGFRAASSVLPADYGKINTNILPSACIEVYKLLFFLISLFVFISGLFFIAGCIKNCGHPDLTLLISYAIVFSFWGINFYFVTVNDANRFKYPADPFIIAIFVFYTDRLINNLRIRRILLRVT